LTEFGVRVIVKASEKPTAVTPTIEGNSLVSRRIAVISGDGVRPGALAQGVIVLERAAALCGFELNLQELLWGSAYYRRHRRMMPLDGIEILRTSDAAYFGAMGVS
jgi:tartrate dehydrogenase/decarboxylase/D-malate dehydrogenase